MLSLGYNGFSGNLSSDIGNLTGLKQLSLEMSGLSGTIPDSLEELLDLTQVQLQFNAFTGEVPEGLCTISSLAELKADCNEPGKVTCACCSECCDGTHQDCEAQN